MLGSITMTEPSWVLSSKLDHLLKNTSSNTTKLKSHLDLLFHWTFPTVRKTPHKDMRVPNSDMSTDRARKAELLVTWPTHLLTPIVDANRSLISREVLCSEKITWEQWTQTANWSSVRGSTDMLLCVLMVLPGLWYSESFWMMTFGGQSLFCFGDFHPQVRLITLLKAIVCFVKKN